MRILALETTEAIGSVAAAVGDKLLSQQQLDPEQRSAQSLAPAVRRLLEQVGWQPGEVQLVAVSAGPGSFTGLRVGVTTAKVLAYAAGAEILGIDTLEAIAAAAPQGIDRLHAVVDAQRGDVAVREFHGDPEGWLRPTGAARLVPLAAWLATLPAGAVVSGPGLAKLGEKGDRYHLCEAPSGPFRQMVPVPFFPHVALDPILWAPTAANVARLAWRDYTAGRRDDPFRLVPHYSRRPAAEEKRDG
jgi:tRNA threonylcarbamoyladenosine biosynthesis protein TsaB